MELVCVHIDTEGLGHMVRVVGVREVRVGGESGSYRQPLEGLDGVDLLGHGTRLRLDAVGGSGGGLGRRWRLGGQPAVERRRLGHHGERSAASMAESFHHERVCVVEGEYRWMEFSGELSLRRSPTVCTADR